MAIQKLLDQLCVDLGFCLPRTVQDQLIDNPGNDVDGFTDRVVIAEGFDPVLMDGELRQQVRNRVAAVLEPSPDSRTRTQRKRSSQRH